MSKRTMKERYSDKKPIGVLTTCNLGGLAVFEPDEQDRYDCDLVSSFHFGNGYEKFRKSVIKYTASGKGYIERYRRRYYLSEIMRVW